MVLSILTIKILRFLFNVGSPSEVMKIVEAFSVSVEDSTNPIVDASNPSKGGSPWFYLVGLTTKTAVYHYLRWHSTVNKCADIEYISTDFLLQSFDADRLSLYDAVNSLMNSAVGGRAICDRQGKLFFEIDAEAIPSAITNIELGIQLTKADWIDIPNIIERTSNDVSYIELGGVKWNGAVANTYTPLLLSAPGETPAYRGNNIRLSGFAFSSLAQAKAVAGNIYAHRNSQFPAVSLDITGNYRNFDLTPLEAVQLSLSASDTFRGHSWSNKPFTMERIEWTYNSTQQFLRPNITLSETTVGFDADDLEIPEIPPSDGFEQPPIVTPPLPIWPPPVPVPVPVTITTAGWVQNYLGPSTGYVNFHQVYVEENVTCASTGITVTTAGFYLICYGAICERDPNALGLQSEINLEVDGNGLSSILWEFPPEDSTNDRQVTSSKQVIFYCGVGEEIRLLIVNANYLTTFEFIDLAVVKI